MKENNDADARALLLARCCSLGGDRLVVFAWWCSRAGACAEVLVCYCSCAVLVRCCSRGDVRALLLARCCSHGGACAEVLVC